MEEEKGKDIYIKTNNDKFFKINIPTNNYRVYSGDTLDAVKKANESPFSLDNIDSVFFKIKNGTYELLDISDYDNLSNQIVSGKKSRKIKSKRRPKKKRSQKKRKMSKKRGKK